MNFKKAELSVRSVNKPSFTKIVSGYTVVYDSDWNAPVEIATYKTDSGWIAVDSRSGFQVNAKTCKTRKEMCETAIATLNEVGEIPFWKRMTSFLAAVLEQEMTA